MKVVKESTRILFSALAAMAIVIVPSGAQENRSAATMPVLRYDPPSNFMRSGGYPPEDYISNQYNGSIQVYPFEPFTGNIAEAFERTLLRDKIDPRHREERVTGRPQFSRGEMPGAQAVLRATFDENNVGIVHPHVRIVVVASGFYAIVDATTINPQLFARLTPDFIAMLRTMRVETTAAPPSLTEGPGPEGEAIAGLYRGIKQKFMTGLTFQASYYTPATHYYLFSKTGRVYRAYDRAPAGDANLFDFDQAERADPVNSGRYAVRDGKLYIKMGKAAMIVTELPNGNTLTIESVNYQRQ